MLSALLILLYVIILALEVPALLKNRFYKELLVFIVLFGIGIYLSFIQFKGSLNFNPLSPLLSLLASGK
ncbi:hypothetical protein [Thermosyntropha sp.]|uniref:hypothetical protein n=1 Tax=Thermosyntropha sp. TaxID=2740820 RepID=UPI0025CFD99E|nr:hypothetical protein [Thermosyntropha sp.]MBO8159774.1 hypothetical protein [Thermosyntropha sp.]